jgi:osmotically-inducible protein OsmY
VKREVLQAVGEFCTPSHRNHAVAASKSGQRRGATRARCVRGAIVEEDAMTTEADIRLRDAVLRQLDWDPEIDASGLAVAAQKGIVTLTGYIDSYPGEFAAEHAASQVEGVRAVANDIEVRFRSERTDADLAKEAARALRLQGTVPDGVQALVRGGCVTLAGTVTCPIHKADAGRAVRNIRGVRAVMNHIALRVSSAPTHD